ncbi:MAG: DUF1992 domain-containing protein [Phycisphaerae bacterium]|nr:DUF1992 domain-containing protein [Phycisphaerae bacterium]
MLSRHLDVESVLRRVAERRIEEAMRAGKFDNLPGAGRPLELEPIPPGEEARLRWWALRILRQNDHIPEEVRWRKQVALLKLELAAATEEARVRELVTRINALVRKINTLGTNAIPLPVAGVDEAEQLRRVRGTLRAEASHVNTPPAARDGTQEAP